MPRLNYVKASKTPTQTYPAGLEAESSSTSILCVCACVCVCVCVCARARALLERPWYVRAAKNQSIFYTYYMKVKKKDTEYL